MIVWMEKVWVLLEVEIVQPGSSEVVLQSGMVEGYRMLRSRTARAAPRLGEALYGIVIWVNLRRVW